MSIEYSNRVWQSPDLKGSKKLVMLALADHADRQGDCHPGTPLLVEKTGLTDRHLRRVINDLAADGYISIEARAIGRGKRPHYRLFPCEEKRTFCPTVEEKADISGDKSGHFVHEKADISVPIQSHARSEPITEPTAEPREKRARATLPSTREPASKTVRHTSPHLQAGRFVAGYIPQGTGRNAVEVYYERFSINQDEARLNAIAEDDLTRLCPDLDTLREVVTAYSRTPFRLGNVQLILDWYRDGIPDKHKGEQRPAQAKLSDAQKSALLTRAKTAQSSIATATKFKTYVDPAWQQAIDTAKGYGLL